MHADGAGEVDAAGCRILLGYGVGGIGSRACQALAVSAPAPCLGEAAPVTLARNPRRFTTATAAVLPPPLLLELAAGAPGVLVETADMGHTDHGCFDECTMGRESRLFEPPSLA